MVHLPICGLQQLPALPSYTRAPPTRPMQREGSRCECWASWRQPGGPHARTYRHIVVQRHRAPKHRKLRHRSLGCLRLRQRRSRTPCTACRPGASIGPACADEAARRGAPIAPVDWVKSALFAATARVYVVRNESAWERSVMAFSAPYTCGTTSPGRSRRHSGVIFSQ